MRGVPRQIAVVLAALVNVGLNALAGAGLLFDVQTGAVSDAAPTPITPAGWAFSIWSVIFLGVIVFAVWQALPAQRGPRYDRLGVPFVIANLLNGFWQIPWLTGRFGLAAVVIVGILASLAWLYVRLDALALRGIERWVLGVPAALWMAWLMVAAPLNLTIWLREGLGWDPAGTLWPVVLVLLVAAVGAWLLARTGDVAAARVFLWADAAIAVAHPDLASLRIALAVGAVAFVASAALGARRHGPFPTAHA